MKGLAFAILMVLSSCSMAPAFAHDWYDPYCCNTKDCAEISASSVTATDNGWVVVLEPGDHPLVTKRNEYLVPYQRSNQTGTYAQTRTSKDDNFHACLYPTEEVMRCFYVPPMGF